MASRSVKIEFVVSEVLLKYAGFLILPMGLVALGLVFQADRESAIHVMQDGFGLMQGMSVERSYYASVFTTVLISYMMIVNTLCHKKLVTYHFKLYYTLASFVASYGLFLEW